MKLEKNVNAIIEIAFESGLINKETYEEIKRKYK